MNVVRIISFIVLGFGMQQLNGTIAQIVGEALTKVGTVFEEAASKLGYGAVIAGTDLENVIEKAAEETVSSVDKQIDAIVEVIATEQKLPSSGYAKTALKNDLKDMLTKILKADKEMSLIAGRLPAEQQGLLNSELAKFLTFKTDGELDQAISQSKLLSLDVKPKITAQELKDLVKMKRDAMYAPDKFKGQWPVDPSLLTKIKVQLRSLFSAIKSIFWTETPLTEAEFARSEMEIWARACKVNNSEYKNVDRFVHDLKQLSNASMEEQEAFVEKFQDQKMTLGVLNYLIELTSKLPAPK